MQPEKLFISSSEFISMINPLILEEESILKYLYVKQHSVTKLLYFGMTESDDPIKYPGSGVYWKRHCRKHGGKKFIKTICVWIFNCQSDCTKFALEFSEANNIVKSELWANFVPENGLNGQTHGYKHTEESILKRQNTVKTKSIEEKIISSKKMSDAGKGRIFSEEHRKNMSEANKKRFSDPNECKKLSDVQQNRSAEKKAVISQILKDAFNNRSLEEKEKERERKSSNAKIRYSDPAEREKQRVAQIGYKTYNNGYISKKFKVDPGLPWVLGELPRLNRQTSLS